MEERLYEIHSFYVRHTSEKGYSIEFLGRSQKITRLNFDEAEGIELLTDNSVEIKTTFLNLHDPDNRIWNVRFAFPLHLRVRFTGKILIEVC